jgi:FSR family fosmidomycin resistance protein-like MFS transporter
MTAYAVGSEPAAQRSFGEVWVITIGHALTHWYPATFYLLLPLIGNELGLSYGQIGSILTVQAVAAAISNIPGGILVDSVGKKSLLMALSLFWIGAPYLAMGFTDAYWIMLVCSALVGIGNNLWHPTAIPLLAQRFPERRGLAVAIHGMGGNVGDAVAPLVVGAMLAAISWRSVVVMNVVPGVIMSVLILIYLGRQSRQSGPVAADGAKAKKKRLTLRDIRNLLGDKTILMLCTGSSFRSMTQSGLLTFLPLYLAREMNYSLFWVGIWMFTLQAAGFAAAPIAGHLSDKMGRRRIIMGSMAMTALVLVLMAFAGGSSLFVLAIGFLGFFLFAIRAVMQAWILDASPANMGGTAIGVLFGMQAVGSAIGPLVGGILADSYGLTATFYFLAATIVIANIFIVFTPGAPQHRPAEPSQII